MSEAPLWSLTAVELVAGYRTGTFTPVQALQSILARLDAVNPRLNAVVALDRAGALQAAQQSTQRWQDGLALSKLDGVPISIKDSLHQKGLPATWGSRLLVDFVPDEDEPPVALLRAAGAVLFGKTNVPEFTVQGYTSNLVFGTTFNPHALDRTPGGSTGGGAAAVAAGIGPLGIGTDAGGSIRRPAAHCGLFALKPSIGQIARYDGFPHILADFEVIGLLARSAADLETLRQILEVPDPGDPRSLLASVVTPELPAKPRIAFMPVIGDNPVDPRIAAATERLAHALRDAGAIVETIAAPFDPARTGAIWSTVVSTGIAWYLAKFPNAGEMVNPSALALATDGVTRTTGQMIDALTDVGALRREAGEFFEDYDLLLCPSIAALAWPADEIFPPEIDGKPVGPRGHAVFTSWMNITGLPSVAVPIAMTDDGGGIGVQFVGAPGSDRELLHFIETSPVLQGLSPAPLAKLD